MSPAAYVNGYKAADFKDFSKGLNLRDKADAVGDGEAIDLLNVVFWTRGAIDQRDGYEDLTPNDLTNRVDSMAAFYKADGTRQLIAGCGNRIEAISNTGGVVASRIGVSAGPWTFARFGDPLHEYLFAANGIDTIQRWDGTGWASGDTTATVDETASRAMPKAGAITVTASVSGASAASNAANRLVATAFGTQTAAGPGGTVSNPSRVYFSNPGLPEKWETDGYDGTAANNYTDRRGRNWIDLTPGDGEAIIAAVTWRELVFIFKQTKFFVLWGEGVAANGTPTFQVREVVNNIGLASAQAVCVGRDGVYFFNRRGVYRTNGSDPVLVSDIVTPMWSQDPDVYFQSEPINLSRLDLVRMLWHLERVYVAVPTGVRYYNDRILVYDTIRQWWSLYDLHASAMASFQAGGFAPTLHHGYSDGPQRIGGHVLGLHTDRGQPITSRWRSGWADYGVSAQKTIRETKVWGAGAVTVSFSADFNRTQKAGLETFFGSYGRWPIDGAGSWQQWIDAQNGVWPGAGQVSDVLIRYAVRGTVFSTQFSNSPHSPTWAVHRVARHLREIREPSIV